MKKSKIKVLTYMLLIVANILTFAVPAMAETSETEETSQILGIETNDMYTLSIRSSATSEEQTLQLDPDMLEEIDFPGTDGSVMLPSIYLNTKLVQAGAYVRGGNFYLYPGDTVTIYFTFSPNVTMQVGLYEPDLVLRAVYASSGYRTFTVQKKGYHSVFFGNTSGQAVTISGSYYY